MPQEPEPRHPRPDWRQVTERLSARPAADLTAAELDELASALFWLNEPWTSVDVRGRAHRAWLDQGEPERAARSAWHVFYEHWLVGEVAVATGWLARARRLVTDDDSNVAGWLALAHSDVAAADGRPDEAVRWAEAADRIGRATDDPDLVAMGLQALGRHLVAAGELHRGLACLDEAMVSVIGNELGPLYTGWTYCNVLSTCHAVGDLRRASEWSDAANRWCASLREGLLYPGLCRVYAAQLAQLRGDWDRAERDARQACRDLEAFDRRYAGAAHHVVGDLCRLRGRVDEADRAYARSHELGHDPQPGLALLQVWRGRTDEGLTALRSAMGPDLAADDPLLPRLQRLTALIDLADRAGDVATVVDAAARLVAAAENDGAGNELAGAYALAARARAALSTGDPASAIETMRAAIAILVDLGFGYEAARCRQLVARAARDLGDELTARTEGAAADRTFERLGAVQPDRGQPARDRASPDLARSGGLSAREVEVLGVVADGLTNRQVAERLHLSPHTVARHLSNVFAKLGVRTRTAAVTAAASQGLFGQEGPS